MVFPSALLGISPALAHGGDGLVLDGGPPNLCTNYRGVIAPNETEARAGSTVYVNGTGFYTEGGAIDLYWGQTGQSNPYQLAGTAFDDDGAFSAELTLPPIGPAYAAGTYNITAEDQIDDCGSTSFTLTTGSEQMPQLTIGFPESGIAGTATSVSGTYFSDSASITPISIGGDGISCSGGTPVTTAEGSFVCDFTIPDALSAGTYPVIATDPEYGQITSTNEFTDTGGQTTTSIDCAPNPIGTSSSYAPFEFLRPSSNCTATVTDPGSHPTGTITWSSSSTSGVFFTWIYVYGEYSYTPTSTCTLDAMSQCSIYYADSDPGLPTITGQYSGDDNNLAGSGTDSLLVVPITTPTVTVSCDPSYVIVSSSCTADVTGSSPTGNVSWTAANEYVPSEKGSFATTTCTLVGGSCSVTYYGPSPYLSCTDDPTEGCAAVILITAEYSGDVLNSLAFGSYAVASGTAADQYDAYTSGVIAELPSGITCTYCKNTSGFLGGLGVKTLGDTEHVSGYSIGPDNNVIDASDAFAVLGSAPAGEVSATGTSNNAGDAEGEVFIADTVTVTGQCEIPGNLDPGNLLDCLGISISVSGDVQADCDDSNGGCMGIATSTAAADFEMCDLDQPTSYGYACASGGVAGAACAGSGCTGPCPGPADLGSVCTFEGSASLDFQSPSPMFFGPDTVVSSGDTLYLSQSIGGMVADTALGSATLRIDPSFKIVNLDPSTVTVSVGAAEVLSLENPSVLQMMSTIAPNPVAAGSPVTDTTTLTNAGTSALTNITAYGSMDGPLSCPDSTLLAGGDETCTGAFSPVAPGAQADVVIANGTNATFADVTNGTSAPFTVTPTPYAVTFNETGLPTGASWTVILNGTPENSTGSTITFSEPYGPYSYEVIPPVGYSTPASIGSLFVFDSATGLNLTIGPGPEGPVIGAIAELYAVYDQRPDLQAAFPDANDSLSGFTALVSWAGSVVEGATPDANYTALAPFGFYYTLMATYNSRADLASAIPNAYGDWNNFTELVDWAGNVVNDSFADSSASTLAPFGPWYALMLTYDNRTDLQAAFPDAFGNFTNFTELVNWAGEVVNDSFVDSANSTLQKFGYYYDLMMVYDERPDLQSAFPDAFTNWTSEQALIWWAGAVVNGTIVDSSNSTLQAFGYWYDLFGYVYENRADLLATFPLADTDGASYQALIVWAADVVLGDFPDSAYFTLLPYASEYEALA